jgi:hypothetical protein
MLSRSRSAWKEDGPEIRLWRTGASYKARKKDADQGLVADAFYALDVMAAEGRRACLVRGKGCNAAVAR